MTKQPGGKQSAKHSAQIDPRFQIDGNERFAGSTDENAHDDIDSTAASGDEGPRNEACADEESDDMDVANDANAKSTNLRTDNVSTDRTNARSDAKPTKTKDKKPKKLKPLTEEGLVEFRKKEENKGVCYLSRVPPYLRVTALRKALSGYGTDVLRIFLQPEDTAVRARRLKSGGNKKKCFSEGWVEFADKRRAKRIANTLNNTPVRGRERARRRHRRTASPPPPAHVHNTAWLPSVPFLLLHVRSCVFGVAVADGRWPPLFLRARPVEH
eukprot:6190163-Pleurochrysis_carterae.AAC.3